MATGLEYSDGGVRVLLNLHNRSRAITFHISDVVVLARRFDAASGQMRLVGELRPTEDLDLTVAAGESVPVTFENTAIDADVINAILRDPRALTFRVARYQLARVDSTGAPTADYAALAEPMIRQTGLVVVDYGNGTVERHAVATNVRRNAECCTPSDWTARSRRRPT
jgi:hypothetical protein